jgi:hypothetical protein
MKLRESNLERKPWFLKIAFGTLLQLKDFFSIILLRNLVEELPILIMILDFHFISCQFPNFYQKMFLISSRLNNWGHKNLLFLSQILRSIKINYHSCSQKWERDNRDVNFQTDLTLRRENFGREDNRFLLLGFRHDVSGAIFENRNAARIVVTRGARFAEKEIAFRLMRSAWNRKNNKSLFYISTLKYAR